MSEPATKKKRQTKKAKAAEAAPPQPLVVASVETTPAATVAPAVVEPEPPVAEVIEETVEEESSGDAAPQEKVHKKKQVYEELRTGVDETLNKILEDKSNAKTQKNKDLVNLLSGYERLIKKIKTNVKKVEPKEKRSVVRDKPSGFNVPLQITEEIAAFAGWQSSEKKSRTDVTKALCDYVKNHGLQQPDNKRNIIPDERLTRLLRYTPSEKPLSYSTMQKHIGHLFVQEAKTQA